MRKRLFQLCVAVVACGALAAFVSGAGCSKKAAVNGALTLKAADDHPLDYPTTQGLLFMKKKIEAATGGRIQMKIYPAAVLGSKTQTIENTQMGTLDINRVSLAPLTAFSPKVGVFSMPYVFRDEAHFRKVLDGPIGDEVAKSLESKGIKLIAYYNSGARSFYNKTRPVNSPADLAGLKIRVQKSQIMTDLVNTLGASATPMSFEEVYTSIQTGAIDGAENNAPSYVSTNHYDVAKFYSLTEHARVPDVVLISMKSWNKMSPADQKIVMDAAKESEIEEARLWDIREKADMEKLKKAGVKINTPDVAPFREKAKSMYDKYKGDYGDLIDRIQKVR